MGSKYTTQASSGYNATPPADDGTVSEANKTKWSTIKTKLGDPLKTFAEAINTALVAAFNYGPNAQSSSYVTVAGDHDKTIETTAGVTLLAAITAGAGYTVNIYNSHATATIVITPSGVDTIGGVASTMSIGARGSVTLRVNNAANGYLLVAQAIAAPYIPTLTDVLNVAVSVPYTSHVLRVGNQVIVTGKLELDPTSASAETKLGISLPIASDLVEVHDCLGLGVAPLANYAIYADATNNRAELYSPASVYADNHTIYFHFAYTIK